MNVPLEAPYLWAPGVVPGLTRTIVEVETAEGLVGFGEAPGASASAKIEREYAPPLLGEDPADLERCHRRAVPPLESIRNLEDVHEAQRSYSGIELALWDLVGKERGLPVYQLLGGAVRKEIAFAEYFAPRIGANGIGSESSPVDVARYCARMAEEHGSEHFEGKVGMRSLRDDLAMVREVRHAIGEDRHLRLDANMGWELGTAREALRQMAQYNLSNVEDPVSSLFDMAELRRHSSIPFSSHTPDLRAAIATGVPDALVLNLATLGGIRPTVKFINACELLGKRFWFYSGDAAIATAGYLQVSAACGWLMHPHQSLLRWQVDDVVAEGAFRPESGVVAVPEGPGLGVQLDREALRRGAERFDTSGPYDSFGTEHGLYRRLPRF